MVHFRFCQIKALHYAGISTREHMVTRKKREQTAHYLLNAIEPNQIFKRDLEGSG